MNFGFNSNVHVQESVYHVQTEDRGPSHPYLDTVVYESGRVVYKRSSSYKDFAAAGSTDINFAERLHERLAQQHHEVIAQLEAGTLALARDAKPQTEESPSTAASSAGGEIDVRLLNPKTCFVPDGSASVVNLEIELLRRNTKQTVGDAEVEALLQNQKERVHCQVGQTDGAGRVTLKFPMPAAAAEGSSLVIRATDGSVYGELRFRLKAKRQTPMVAPILK